MNNTGYKGAGVNRVLHVSVKVTTARIVMRGIETRRDSARGARL
jgi:hypothetical protein